MTGFGQAAAQTLIFDPDALTFPITNIGTSSAQLQVQVTNFGTTGVTFSGVSLVGGAPSDFSISSNTCTSLNEGGSCYIYVTFTPTKAGARQENLEITSNAPGSPFVVLLLGTGQALTQTINISPNSISYGVNDIGATSSQQYFQIQNTGTGPVTMEGIVISGANSNEYAIASNGCPALGSPLAAGSSCYVYVTFSPNANGPQTASLSVTDTATGSPQTASVFGVGQTVSSTAAFSKSTVDLGAETLAVVSGQASISVQNTGNINITVSSVLLGGTNPADFSISSDSCTSGAVAPSSYCYVYVTFTPKATGLRKATLTFTDNATGSPQVVNLEGTGVAVTQNARLAVSGLRLWRVDGRRRYQPTVLHHREHRR
jgi:hypothetical protein